MNKKNRVVALIPARGGSKGIKNKNIVDLGGKPLITWSIEAANESIHIDDVAVTSDDDKILSIAGESGAQILVKRPENLASDDAETFKSINSLSTAGKVVKSRTSKTLINLFSCLVIC